eukprot:NODE_856_length_577_cov_228.495556_g846_i0.p1 GENE.NODE_856_length_577_cov_228.495556_g846_i0~~NODE_856_length_577_cov_228.495556_g846_i0.p1  ORF type:complete len:86 (+),score=9.95 NODE_856_length_577_cov_228.495556_g846_i0:239-496(+)
MGRGTKTRHKKQKIKGFLNKQTKHPTTDGMRFDNRGLVGRFGKVRSEFSKRYGWCVVVEEVVICSVGGVAFMPPHPHPRLTFDCR